MATERDFITPADVVVLTTANVVGNTAFVDLYSNTARAQTYPVFSQNFALSPYLDRRWTYVRTSNATFLAANGIISIAGANTPRFDHDPVTLQCKGLLLEEGRVNLVRGATRMVGTGWSFSDGLNGRNSTIIPDAGVAPDGTNNACFYVHVTDVSAYHTYGQTLTTQIANNTTYTHSVFFKANTTPQEPSFLLGQYDNLDAINSVLLSFSFAANGTITGWTSSGSGSNVVIQSVGSQNYPNNWVRLYYSFRYTGGPRTIAIKHDLNGGSLSASTNNVRGVYMWGSQLEQGPFPTSFIPTSDNLTATRVTDTAYIDGDKLNTFKDDRSMTVVATTAPLAWHGNTAMVSSTEQRYNTVWTLLNNPAPPGPFVPAIDSRFPQQGAYFSYLNDVSPHRISYYHAMFNNIENYIGFNGYNLTVNNYITDASYITNAITMRSNNWIMVSNGTLSSTNLNYFAGANNNYFQIGGAGNVYFKRLAIYNTQLSNTEMIGITTT